jgi:MFS family permease
MVELGSPHDATKRTPVVVDTRESNQSSTALPRVPMACMFAVQMNEALQINVLFPFLVFMVEFFGFAGASNGVHAGILASSFCGAQFFSSWFWGQISDRVGLKPCLIAGTAGSAVLFFFFGLSSTFYQAVTARFCAGA